MSVDDPESAFPAVRLTVCFPFQLSARMKEHAIICSYVEDIRLLTLTRWRPMRQRPWPFVIFSAPNPGFLALSDHLPSALRASLDPKDPLASRSPSPRAKCRGFVS